MQRFPKNSSQKTIFLSSFAEHISVIKPQVERVREVTGADPGGG